MQNDRSDQLITTSIIIPVYNNLNLVRQNLPKVVEAYLHKPNRIIEIITIDDASTDESPLYIKKHFPQVRLIRHSVNRGYSASVNTGARSAKGNFLVLLNSDVIPEKNFLSKVYDYFNNKDVFAVSFHEKGYAWARGYFKDGYVEYGSGSFTGESHETFWVSGGSAIYRRDYWMKLGGMDEKLLSPFYWEDIDLSYRAAKRGLICLWDPGALVIHDHESTIGKLNQTRVSRIKERNQLLFHWKNITSKSLFRKHIIGIVKRISKHPGYIKIVLMALSKAGLAFRLRKKEIKESKISDEAIFAKFQE